MTTFRLPDGYKWVRAAPQRLTETRSLTPIADRVLRERSSGLKWAIILGLSLTFPACSSPSRPRQAVTPTSVVPPTPLRPPVIVEEFTVFGCGDQNTTFGRMACVEQDELELDHQIDQKVASVFSRLSDDAARRRLVEAEKAWFSYRGQTCASRSDLFEGGSEAPAEAARCAVGLDRQHLENLTNFDASLRDHP